jgi:hypothetical protein
MAVQEQAWQTHQDAWVREHAPSTVAHDRAQVLLEAANALLQLWGDKCFLGETAFTDACRMYESALQAAAHPIQLSIT